MAEMARCDGYNGSTALDRESVSAFAPPANLATLVSSWTKQPPTETGFEDMEISNFAGGCAKASEEDAEECGGVWY